MPTLNQVDAYEMATRNIRWGAVALTVGTASFLGLNNRWLWLLVGAAIVFNSLRYVNWLLNRPVFAAHLFTIIVDNALILALMWVSGQSHSPYFLYLILTMVSVAYWYGSRGVALGGGAQVLALALLFTHEHWPHLDQASLAGLVLQIGTLVLVGALVAMISRIERTKRLSVTKLADQLTAQKQRLITLLNSLSDPVIAINLDGRVTSYNGAALALLNTNSSLLGRPLRRLLPLRDEHQHQVDLLRLTDGLTTPLLRNDLVYSNSNRETINLELSISPINVPFQSKATDSGFIIIFRDITKEHSLEEQREEFVAVTSHELRTPIAIAEANLSTTLLPQIMGDRVRLEPLLKKAYENVLFLADLVNDLTTLARAEQAKLQIDLVAVEPAAMVQKLFDNYRHEALQKGLELKVKLGKHLKPVFTSEHMLYELLQNFMTNAIKYTAKGHITISAVPVHETSVVFAIADTGQGIATSDQKHLFEKFYRAEDYRTRQTRGTGLGLYISQKLAQRLNGKIWYNSQLNKGSSFYLEVPPFSKLSQDQPKVAKATLEDYVETL